MTTEAATIDTAPALDPATAFTGRIKRVWKSPFYLGGMMIVAVTMILLPIIYVGIVALVGYGIYYHATEHLAILGSGAGFRWRLVVYIGPLIIGAILLVFMIKPLFARPPRREKRVSLVREREPLLFAFVERLCEVVGSPKPKRIDVDCQVNASASFRHGMWSLFWPGDLVLTIGVPLAAGLSLRDFTGVLAHEFGHFAQGLGMRFSYVIASVNGWFARVVYERDSWDEWLEGQIEEQESWIAVIMQLSRLFVLLTRGVLFVLMALGHMISCGMSRQMEFDADLHAIRTTGSASFESTERRLAMLSVGESAVYGELKAAWRDGKLADNLPLLIAAKPDEFPPPIREKIETSIDTGKTGWFDTHPSGAARIRRARKADEPGVFVTDGPATQLFSDFNAVSKAITLSHYHDIIGPNVTAQNLISTGDIARRRDDARRSREAADRYYFGCVTLRRPILLDAFSRNFKLDEQTAHNKLASARDTLHQHAGAIRERVGRFNTADARLSMLAYVDTMLKAGETFDAKAFDLTECNARAVAEARTSAERDRRAAAEDLVKIEAVMRTRTETALRLMSADSVAKRVRGIDRLHKRTRELLSALNSITSVGETLGKLRQGVPGLQAMGKLLSDDDKDEDRIRQALRVIESQHTHLGALRNMLMPFHYPFAHAAGRITLAQYAIAKVPDRNDFGGAYAASREALEAMDALYARLLGEVAQICEAVESALGFKPLKAPPPPAPNEATA